MRNVKGKFSLDVKLDPYKGRSWIHDIGICNALLGIRIHSESKSQLSLDSCQGQDLDLATLNDFN